MFKSQPPKQRLETQVRYADGGTHISLKGIIDEPTSTILEDAFSGLVGKVSIDLGGVERVTSYGLGVLMRLLSAASKVHKIEYVACSEIIVDQFQMLDFSRYGRIASMFVRYECEHCSATATKLVHVKNDLVRSASGAIEAPPMSCRCGGKMRSQESLDFVTEHVTGWGNWQRD
jgi:anti-anti-sigma regulatory factor